MNSQPRKASVLVEVPTMLLVVKIANATQHWYGLGKQN
jgi:ACR3 family arsenite efflux pump ArsB